MTPHIYLKLWGHVFPIFTSDLADYMQIQKERLLLHFPSQEELLIKILALIFQGNRQQKAANEILFLCQAVTLSHS